MVDDQEGKCGQVFYFISPSNGIAFIGFGPIPIPNALNTFTAIYCNIRGDMDQRPLWRWVCILSLLCHLFTSSTVVFSASSNRQSIKSLLSSLPELKIFNTALQKSKAGNSLRLGKVSQTFFVPSNIAIEKVINNSLLTCVDHFFVANPCKSVDDMLRSTNLDQLILNHVVDGNFEVNSRDNGTRIQVNGDAVVEIETVGKLVYVGNALVASKYTATDGILYVIESVLGSKDPNTLLSTDVSINETAVLGATKLSDADIFSRAKWQDMAKGAQLFNIPGFRRNRDLLGYQDGGLYNPPALTFDPTLNNECQGAVPDAKFKYPVLDNVTRPAKDDDLAFMTVLELGALLRTKQAAGAVLIAKLVSGSLAYDDIWFGGQTKNPWNIAEGSTGSSAGPAVSTSAGNVPFALGSETAGSITFPAARTGVTAIRPSFGLVGRSWVMQLSASLDKIGPFCRSAADCAVILDIIRGRDPDDISSKDIQLRDPFQIDITKLVVGYLPDADMEVVRVLASRGVAMVKFDLNYTVNSAPDMLNFIMDVEMLANFDHWQRSGLDDEYEAQWQWPLENRRARLISAVDYVQTQRVRGMLQRQILKCLQEGKIDAFIGNATDWEKVSVGNLVGIPVLVLPTGLKNITDPPPGGTNRRTTIQTGIYAAPHRDGEVLALAMAYQEETTHHLARPPVNNVGPGDPLPVPRKLQTRRKHYFS